MVMRQAGERGRDQTNLVTHRSGGARVLICDYRTGGDQILFVQGLFWTSCHWVSEVWCNYVSFGALGRSGAHWDRRVSFGSGGVSVGGPGPCMPLLQLRLVSSA